MITATVLATFFCALPCQAAAQPAWDRTDVTLAPDLRDVTAAATFTYTNHAALPVRIVPPEKLCPCVRLTMPEHEVGPGESGTVGVEIVLPDNVSEFSKPIPLSLESPGGTAEKAVLTVRALGLRPYTMDERIFDWKLGGPITEKEAQITFRTDVEASLGKPVYDGKDFYVALTKAAAAHAFTLVIFPLQTATARSAHIVIPVASKTRCKSIDVYAFIQ